MNLPFKQVDVFATVPFMGNPVAVVLGADALETERMQQIASWTNLSETTFVLKPKAPGADYRLRIFTPSAEMPFAGHPTIGSAHAVREAGLVPSSAQALVQECAQGLVRLHVKGDPSGDQLFLELPEAKVRALDPAALASLDEALGVRSRRDVTARIIDVGATWITCALDDASTVRRLAPDMSKIAILSQRLGAHGVTVFGLGHSGEDRVVVRSFAPAVGVPEDPVCGSGNGCVATFLSQGDLLQHVGRSYVASQGREVGRNGLVHVEVGEDRILLGGAAVTRVDGTIVA